MKAARSALLRDYGVHLVLLLALASLVAVPVIRASLDAPITPGERSYTELRRAELLSQGTIGYDPLRGELTIPTPYTFLLACMVFLGVPWLLPMLLALALLLLLYPLLVRIVRTREVAALALLAVVVTPTLSVLGTSHSPALLALVLLVCAGLLLMISPSYAWIPLPFALITSPVLGLIGAGCALAWLWSRGRRWQAVPVLLSVAAAFVWFFAWSRSLPFASAVFERPALSDVLFEFGNSGGVSVFFVILGAYGLLSPPLRKRPGVVVSSLALFAASVFIQALMPVTALALAVLCAYGVFDLMQRKWELELLRMSLLLIVACAGIFLLIVSARERVEENPTAQLAHSLAYLSSTHREGSVLSAPGYAPMIEYFTGRRATIDASSRPSDVALALYSRDANAVYGMLESTNTSHVLVTDDMLQTLFSRSDEGILFLMQNTQRFVLVEQTEQTRLWYYIARKQGGKP